MARDDSVYLKHGLDFMNELMLLALAAFSASCCEKDIFY